MIKIKVDLMDEDKKTKCYSGVVRDLRTSAGAWHKAFSGEGSYSLIQASLLEFKRNKAGANGLSEKDEMLARRLGQSLRVICAGVFLEKYDSNIFDLFIESVSKSKLSSIKLTGSCA